MRRRIIFCTWLSFAFLLFFDQIALTTPYAIADSNNFATTNPAHGIGLSPSRINDDPNFKDRFLFEEGKLFAGLIIPNKRGGQFLEIESNQYEATQIYAIRQDFAYNGGYSVGASVLARLGNYLQIGFDGFLVRPTIAESSTFHFFKPGHHPDNSRDWNCTESQVGEMSFEIRARQAWNWTRDSWTPVLGLRFDYCSITFKDPDRLRGHMNSSSYSSSDSADILSKAYIPYIGLHYKQENYFLTGTFRGIVSPVILGTVSYDEHLLGTPNRLYRTTTNFGNIRNFGASFMSEFFMDVFARIGRNIGLGVFLKMGIINSYPQGTLQSFVGKEIISDISYTMNYRKLEYLVGSVMSLSF